MPSSFSSPHFPRQRARSAFFRTVVTAGFVLCLAATSACELRLGAGSPAALPQSSVSEITRDGLARQCDLLSSTARVVSVSTKDDSVARLAAGLDQQAKEYSAALGGVWQPWPTGAPTSYPTVKPEVTAPADATKADLLSALLQGVKLSAAAAKTATDDDQIRLYASMDLSWTLAANKFDETSVNLAGRNAAKLTTPLNADTLQAYDAARYALEEVAARADKNSAAYKRAVADLAYLRPLISASLTAGGEDTRLSAYAAPSQPADSSTSLDQTWARQVWVDAMKAELQSAVDAEPDSTQRSAAVEAAIYAASRAQSWGADLGALPGYQSEQP